MALVRRNEYDWVDIRIGHSTGRVPQAEFYQNYLLQVSHRLRGWNQTHSGAMNMSSELWAHPVTCYRVPFQGGIELSAVLRRSDRIIAWGQHVNTDFTLLKQLKSHQRTLSICYNYIYYNTLRNMTTSLIDFRTKKGKNEKIQ